MTMSLFLISFAATALLVLLMPSSARALSSSASSSTSSFNAIHHNAAVPGLQNGMDYTQLPNSDLIVSKVCMGTMTFGQQNTVDQGVQKLQHAHHEYGINFVDTAEMYPVPTKPETQGLTDQAVSGFLKTVPRQDIVLATKVAGRSDRITWMPRASGSGSEGSALTPTQIKESVDASLQRLGVDYIDLLQLHWPDRYTGGLFGTPDFTPEAYEQAPLPTAFEDQLGALQDLVQAGKIRYIGVSNETPYGVCSFASLAKNAPDLYPKLVSIQNSFSLVVRKDYEGGLAEACYHHQVGLLAYSPLAGGSLSGKYRVGNGKQVPEGSRLTLFPGFMDRYLGSSNEQAVNAYCEIAEQAGLTPAQLALSWCFHNPLVASTIIGATTMEQLDENLKAYDLRLDDAVMDQIDTIYYKNPDPTKQLKLRVKS